MYWFRTLLVLAASCASSHQLQLGLDACDPANYKELDEPHRSSNFKVEVPEEPLCDFNLDEGWYRFINYAGGTIPTTCQENYQCGTVAPIWMNGTLPEESDGEVVRSVCANFNNGDNHCCERSREIKVRKCGSFYVYYLFPTPACPLSYCAGEKAPCPVGTWSPTSFPPCKDLPVIKIPPTLLGPVIPNKHSFYFVCQFNFTKNDPDQRFEISWLFEGKEDSQIPPEILSDPSREAILDGSKLAGHIDQTIACQVRSYLVNNTDHMSGHLLSNAYYAAFQATPARLEFGQKDRAKSISLTSKVPIVCNNNFSCCLQVALDTNGKDDVTISRKCVYELCNEHWDYENNSVSLEINVTPKTIGAQDESGKQLLLSFETLLTTGGAYMKVFDNTRPNDIQIAIEARDTSTCSAITDPHFTSFDGMYYHLFLVGDFTVVEVPERYFEVQIRTWVCNGPVACICGIVIREENDVIRIDQCDQQYAGTNTSPVISAPNSLQEGTVVERSADGKQIGVYLRSGAEVKFDTESIWISMYITLPSIYKNMAKGICGTNDGNKDNEFIYPNGNQDPPCNGCVPDTFMEAWRAGGDERKSLFESLPDPVKVEEDNRYCTCQAQSIVCDANLKTVRSGTACSKDCTPQTPGNPPLKGWKRDIVYEDLDEPDFGYYVRREISLEDWNHNKTWSIREDDGFTEAQARDMCLKAIQKSQLSSGVDESSDIFRLTLESCLSDILYTGSTVFLNAATTAFTSASQVNLAKDPANYVTDATGKPAMKTEFTVDICDVECEEHGHCGEKGGCVCNPGWEGFSCHIESGKGPLLDRIRSGPLCDIVERPCKKIYTDVSNINLSDKLMCRVQPVDEDGNNVGPAVDTEAISLSAFRISCGLPETVVSHKRYKISASNNGTLFGNELSLLVFNSLCMDCDETVCTAKTSACHIDSKCYRDGHINEDDSTQMCDISKATDVWSDVPTTTPVPTTTTTTTVPATTTVPTTTPVPTTTTTTTTTVPTTTTVLTTTTASTTTLGTTDVASVCQRSGLFDGLNPDPSNCHKFIVCTFGTITTVNCQPGLWFDIDTKSCQPPHVANCPAMGKP